MAKKSKTTTVKAKGGQATRIKSKHMMAMPKTKSPKGSTFKGMSLR